MCFGSKLSKDRINTYLKSIWSALAYAIVSALGILAPLHLIGTEDFRRFNLSEAGVNFFVTVFVLYIISLAQSVIDILDLAFKYPRKQFTIKILYYMCFVIVDMGLTLWFTLKYLLSDESGFLWTLFGLTLILILGITFFSHNSLIFMVNYHNKTKRSCLKK